jgi:hypothetical protein
MLLQGILSEAGVHGLAEEVVAEVKAALDGLLKVKGSPVTYGQLEGLRVKAEW